MSSVSIEVNSPNVRYTEATIEADFKYETTSVKQEGDVLKVKGRGGSLQSLSKDDIFSL